MIVRGDADSFYGNPSFSSGRHPCRLHALAAGPDGNPPEHFEASIWTAWVTGAKPRQITQGAQDNKADWGPAPRRH